VGVEPPPTGTVRGQFALQVRGGELTDARFAMDDHGEITFDPSLPLAVDRYDGVRRLTVTAPP